MDCVQLPGGDNRQQRRRHVQLQEQVKIVRHGSLVLALVGRTWFLGGRLAATMRGRVESSGYRKGSEGPASALVVLTDFPQSIRLAVPVDRTPNCC